MTALSDAPQAPSTKAPKVITFVGLGLGLLSLIAFVVSITLLGSRVVDSVLDVVEVERNLVGRVPVPGDGEVRLEPGRHRILVLGEGLVARRATEDGSGGRSVRLTFADPVVTVTGPDGEPVTVTDAGRGFLRSSTFDIAGLGELEVEEAGTYRIEVVAGATATEDGPLRDGAGPTDTSPEVREVALARVDDLDLDTEGWALAGGLVLASILGGLVAGVLICWGGIWWMIRASRARDTMPPPPPPPGWGGGPGWIPPGPAGAPPPPSWSAPPAWVPPSPPPHAPGPPPGSDGPIS